MKLKKNSDTFELPPIGQLGPVALAVDRYRYVLCQVSREVLDEMRIKQRALTTGNPIYFALLDDDMPARLQFYPAADQDYEIVVRYYPPMVEA